MIPQLVRALSAGQLLWALPGTRIEIETAERPVLVSLR